MKIWRMLDLPLAVIAVLKRAMKNLGPKLARELLEPAYNAAYV